MKTKPENKVGRIWTITLYASCTILLFADQNLMAPNLTAIANDFGFDNEERDRKLGGDIALAFWLLGAPAAILVGCLADKDNCSSSSNPRSKLFAWTVWIGEGACLATYFVTTYEQLYWCRALTGFSVGGALPLVYSLLGDLFEAHERHFVSALVGIGTGGGIAIGQGIAGLFALNWRVPFVIVSLPALMLATLIYFGCCGLKDPPRGAMEQAVLVAQEGDHDQDQQCIQHQRMTFGSKYSGALHEEGGLDKLQQHHDNDRERICHNVHDENQQHESLLAFSVAQDAYRSPHWYGTLCILIRTPSFVLLVLQGAPGCVPWGVINSFLNDFLAQDRSMSIQLATLTLLMFGVGNAVGIFFGGATGSYAYRSDPRYPALLAGSMAIVGCIPLWLLINQDAGSSVWKLETIAIIGGVSSGMTGPIIKGTLQNVTLPESRGLAFALSNTFDDFGRGLGPVFVATLIHEVGGNRTRAFNIGVSFWILCGILNFIVFFTVKRDEANIQAAVAAKLKINQEKDASIMPSQNDVLHGVELECR